MLSWEQTTDRSNRRRENSVDWLQQRAWVEIDRTALASNIRQLKMLLSSKTALMAVVKADAYGHGAITVSQTVLEAGANWLGVATIPEGIELRQAGISAPILILGATYTPDQVRALVHWQLQPTLCTPKQALVFAEVLTECGASLPVHLKIDTGMSRLGTPWQEALEFVRMVVSLSQLEIASLYSHFATADDRDPTVMQQQHARFQQILSQIEAAGIPIPRLHIANSAATLTDSHLHYDLVRVGLAVYGLYPAEHLQETIDLRPVLQVKARVTQVKTIPAGMGVSYGYKFIASQPTRIAVVGIGYADGVPRHLSNQLKVILRDRLVPQIGAITMDQLMLDVSAIPDVEVGEVVTLLGKQRTQQISADDWATTLGTISWEILCSFKHRLPRIVQ
jgi:alanine racemase